MEIEAKFSFADAAAFDGWLTRPRLGPYTLGPARLLRLSDGYLDTDDRACLAHGYACRVRLQGDRAIATLKSLGDQQPGGDGVRRRDEQEIDLPAPPFAAPASPGEVAPAWQQPSAWPDSRARALALLLSGGRPLRGLATLRQERHERPLRDGAGREIAALTLDRVSFDDGAPPALELECELSPDGDESAMARIVAALRQEHGFTAAPRSKLGRALHGVALPATAQLALGGEEPPAAGVRSAAATSNEAADTEPYALLALGLAEATPEVPLDRSRRLHRALALLVQGRTADPQAPAAAARDLVQAGEGNDRVRDDDALLAGTLALLALLDQWADSEGVARQVGGRRTRELPALQALNGDDTAEARTLAVLLHLAGALAEAGAGRIALATVRERHATLYLEGEFEGDNTLAQRCAALWREQFAAKLTLRPASAAAKRAGLRYDMPLAAAGRRILAARLAQLQAGLAGLRDETDAEALHDARVAARRMRTILQLLKDAFPRREVRPLARHLRRLASALGIVRDLDVLLARLRDDTRAHDDEQALAPVIARLAAERGKARAALLAQIDAPEHAAWLEALQTLLKSDSRGKRGERRLCDALPEMLWHEYRRVRAYAPGIATADNARLHALRKKLRRLRYGLEFFHELLGRNAEDLIDRTIAVQDALGTLHDSVALLDALQQHDAPERARWRTRAELTRGRRAALALWPTVNSRYFRKALGAACARL